MLCLDCLVEFPWEPVWCLGTNGRRKLGIPSPAHPQQWISGVSFDLPRIFYFLCLGLQEVGLPWWPVFWKPVFLFYVFSSDLAVPVFGEMEHFVVVTFGSFHIWGSPEWFCHICPLVLPHLPINYEVYIIHISPRTQEGQKGSSYGKGWGCRRPSEHSVLSLGNSRAGWPDSNTSWVNVKFSLSVSES